MSKVKNPTDGKNPALADARLRRVLSVTESEEPDTDAVLIERERIHPDPDQPRQYFDPEYLRDLGQSMRRKQVQAIVVRPHPDAANHPDEFMIVGGEGRWRASAPEYGDIPRLRCTLENYREQEAILLQHAENRKRRDLAPIARARGLRRLKTLSPAVAFEDHDGVSDRELTWEEVAQLDGLKGGERSALRYVALLRLPRQVQEKMERWCLSEKHGRALLLLQPSAVDLSGQDEPTKNQARLLNEIEPDEAIEGEDVGRPRPRISADEALKRASVLLGKLPDQHDLELQESANAEFAKQERERRAEQKREFAGSGASSPLRDVNAEAASSAPNVTPFPSAQGDSGFVQAAPQAANDGHGLHSITVPPTSRSLEQSNVDKTRADERERAASAGQREWPNIGYPHSTPDNLPEKPEHDPDPDKTPAPDAVPVHDLGLLITSVRNLQSQLLNLAEPLLTDPDAVFPMPVSDAAMAAMTVLWEVSGELDTVIFDMKQAARVHRGEPKDE